MMTRTMSAPDLQRARSDMIASQIGNALVRSHLIDDLQLRTAMAHREKFGSRLARVVVELRFCTEKAAVAALAEAFHQRKVDLESSWRDALAISKLPAEFCEQHAVFPVSLQDSGKTLVVAMAEPTNLELLDTVASVSGCRVMAVIAGEREILSAIDRHYHHAENVFVSGPMVQPMLLNDIELTFEEADPPPPFADAPTDPGRNLATQIEELQRRLADAGRTLSTLVGVAEKRGFVTAEELRAAMRESALEQ